MELVRNVLAALYGVAVLMLAIATGLVIGTLGILPFAPVPRGRREQYTIRAARLWARLVLRGLLWVDVEQTGAWSLPDGRGAILFCNHRSWLDPLVLIAHTGSNGLSKREIFWIPVIGLYGHLAGAVFFDRRRLSARNRARDEVLALVEGGHRIQVFPEGTRSRDGALREKVHLRLAIDAWERQIPVVPCAVMGTERVLPPGEFAAWPLQHVRLHVGDPLQPGEFPDGDTFARACWDAVRERTAQLATE